MGAATAQIKTLFFTTRESSLQKKRTPEKGKIEEN
jgi:hypothetical protein